MRRVIDEWLAQFRSPRTLIAWLALSLIAALVGPFGTHGLLGLSQRLALWGAVAAVALGLGALVRGVVRRLPGIGHTRWAGLAVAVILTLCLTPLCARLVRAVTDAEIPPQTLAEIAATAFFSTLAICALTRGRPARVPAAEIAPPAVAPPDDPPPDLPKPAPPEPRLLRRFDPALRGRLISISVRDHYVDVVTEAGHASLLMRLSDAMAEAEEEEGARIHRSHWVARHSARSLERSGARLMLVLADGTRLPVSRAQRPQIDGWGLPELPSAADTSA